MARPSIRRKVLGVMLISGVVPVIVVLVLARLGLSRVVDAGIAQLLMDRAEAIANEVDTALANAIEAIEALSAQGELLQMHAAASSIPPPISPDVLTEQMQRLGADFLTDARGRVIVGTPGDSALQNRLLEATQVDSSTPRHVRLLEHFAPGGAAAWLVVLAPVADAQGRMIGHVGRRLEMAGLVEPLLPRQTPESFACALNQWGLRVAGPALDPERQRAFSMLLVQGGGAAEGWAVSSAAGGTHQVTAYRRLRLMGAMSSEGRSEGSWLIVCSYTPSVLLSDLEAHLWRIGLVGLVAVAVFLGLGLALAHRIIWPLRLLRSEVEQISAGHLEQRLYLRTNDELEDLANHINLMAARLAATHDDLASKIEMLRNQTDQLETLRAITRSITETLELPALLATFEREVRRIARFEAITIARVASPRRRLEIIHSGWSQGDAPLGLQAGEFLPIEGSRLGEVVAERAARVIADLAAVTEHRREDEALRSAGVRSAMILPLRSQQSVIGVVALASTEPARYGAAEVGLLAHAAEQLAIGLEHARLYSELRALATSLESQVAARTAELQAAQRRLFQTEKFAATGRLAANVAHEINNPLAIIKNHLRLLSDNLIAAEGGRRRTDPSLDNLRVIEEEIDRIARIVKNLLSFYRPAPSGPEGQMVQINEEIEAIIRLVERGLEKRHVTVRLALCEGLPRIKCSSDLIRQIFLNLIRNAEDAMTGMERGELAITTDVEDTPSGRRIVATVSDTGHGIAPEHLDQIFDPFFTTKAESGTGLGLSVTYSIIESLGGTIEVDSAPGDGTTFSVMFPMTT